MDFKADSMHLFIPILNLALAAPIDLIPQNLQCIQVIKLFGVPPVFVLKFFGELCLVFIVSALISYILKIDKASNE
jgi:uncharacterized membrane protein